MTPPDNWISRHMDMIPAGGRVLDIASGGGRHSALALSLGHHVVSVDRQVGALLALSKSPACEIVEADLEAGPWPFSGQFFDGIIVCNYLWRPLFPKIAECLAPNGVVIWTTFATGNEQFGRPRNPDFLLHRNELLTAFSDALEIVSYADGAVPPPVPAVRQSIVARRRGVDPHRVG